ncbi:MAG: DNA internalization-related competence protein ComEC/Rec2 [Stenotrophobium sp.]
MSLWQILAFTVGILAVCAQPSLPSLALLSALAVPALLPWRGRALYAMAMLGVLLTVWQAQELLAQRWPPQRYGETLWVPGRVVSLPEQIRFTTPDKNHAADAGAADSSWKFLFEPDSQDFPHRIRVSWYRSGQTPRGGDCWRLQLRLRTPHGSFNPGGFDYEGWLFRQGIGATATVRAAQPCEGQDARVSRDGKDAVLQATEGQDARVPRDGKDAVLRATEGQGTQLTHSGGYAVLRLRQSLLDQFRVWLPGDPALGFFTALTLGDTSMLTPADWDVFRVTGTTHLVAISGFNIAIIAGVAFFLLRWLWSLSPWLCLRLPAQRAAMLGAALLALAYAVLAGWQPPVQRAALMLLLFTVAAWRGQLRQPARVLALAWWLVLLLDPLAVLSPGLWLSFGAVAAIFFVMGNRLAMPGWIAGLLLLQLLLSVVLTPLTVYFFHGLSWFSPLVNLLAEPIVSVLTPLLLLAVFLAWALPLLGLPLIHACAAVLWGLREALGWLALNVPHAWIAASAPLAALLLALIGAVLLFVPRGLPLRPLGLICFLPLLWPPQTAPRSGFELTALDVGQGLSVVVRTAHHTLLYDTGPAHAGGYDAGASVVVPYLLSQGVRHVDLMMISHADNDHSGGAASVRRLLTVDDELGALTPYPCRDGQHWDWDGVGFEVLHPDDEQWSSNNGGCVLRIEAGPYAALLPADIEAPAERRLLADKLTSLQADVLLAPHHGSHTSSTQDFIDAVLPQAVIHSAAWHSQFHHPHPSVVARYAVAGALQYVTGVCGALDLHVGEHGVSGLTSWREAHHHFWNLTPQEMAQGQYTVPICP